MTSNPAAETPFIEERVQGFAPIISDGARVLILGSMPSVVSLEKQQYYGKPQNSFWRIMAELFGFEPQLPYADRARMLSQCGVAVWDVLASCVRPGSLDSSIKVDSAITNDLVGLLCHYRTIRDVFFNGRKAEDIFRKQLFAEVSDVRPEIRYICLPSTSPAMAALDFGAKLESWQVVRDAALSGAQPARY